MVAAVAPTRRQAPTGPRKPSVGRRDVQSVRAHTGGSGARQWQGDGGFYVQIERCSGIDKQCASVRHDEDKYRKYSQMVGDAIHQSFDGQIHVEVVTVPTLYAFEIRLMPEELHPKYRPTVVGKDAEIAGGITLFSKLDTKKWPQRDVLVRAVQERCQVPVRINMLGIELSASSGPPEVPEASEKHRAVNQDHPGSTVPAALRRVEFRCTDQRGKAFDLHTGTSGKTDLHLSPGIYTFHFEPDSCYDRLTPNSLVVPAHYSGLEVSINASIKKKCTFLIVDHLGRPFGQFPICLVHRDPRIPPLSLRARVDGKCGGRLSRGTYTVSYDGDPSCESDWPVAPFTEEVEIHDTDIPEFFRISVERTRFTCEVMLRTRFEEPASRCSFNVKNQKGIVVSSGTSSDIGVVACDLSVGHYTLQLTPNERSPFVAATIELRVKDDGSFDPVEKTVQTKTTDVAINLVTPDGEPAPDCLFHLEAKFAQSGAMARTREMKCQANEAGVAIATMSMLEPYIFKVKPAAKAAEYMPQQFYFQTDRRDVTIVVARSIFGYIAEDNVALIIDTSGSMQVYMDDVKIAMNKVITEQFFNTGKSFNIVTYTDKTLAFRRDLVKSSQENLEDAMRFCDAFEAGGGSGLSRAMQHAFQFANLEAMYILTDGKAEMKDDFLNQVRSMYFSHPKRPKLHTIGINCIPRRHTWQGLQAVALLTQATFRPVCLEQANVDAAPPPALLCESLQMSGVDLAHGLAGPIEGHTDEDDVQVSADDEDEYDSP